MNRVLALLLCASSIGFAESWTGALVDAGCYIREEQNVTTKGDVDVNHDRGFEIDHCQPGAKTTQFAVVDQNGQMYKLDPTGNAKAVKLVSERKVKGRLQVTVVGRKSGELVIADSISANQ